MPEILATQEGASELLARLERLPATRSIWRLVTLLSLGCSVLRQLFMTGYVIPGLVKAGLLANAKLAIFAGPALFVAAALPACSSAPSCSASSPTGMGGA